MNTDVPAPRSTADPADAPAADAPAVGGPAADAPAAGAPAAGAPAAGASAADAPAAGASAADASATDVSAADVSAADSLAALDAEVVHCRACPRLVAWREQVAREKRAAFRDETYWGRPVPGFGPHDAALLIVGLAPAAHGGNRTGRIFTGDRSGDVLYAAMHAAGLANQPTSTHLGDGLRLHGTRITAPVRCAPPANKPSPRERDTCRSWLVRELRLLRPTLRAAVVLGAFGWQALLSGLEGAGWQVPRPRPVFGHGAHAVLPGHQPDTPALHLFGCYHVSQQNTFTGRLTPAMLEAVLRTAASTAGLAPA